MRVRDSRPDDVNRIALIYNYYVRETTSSFETEPPTLEELHARRETALSAGLPYLVAEGSGRVMAFAYAVPYRPRRAYRFTAEHSVYVAPDCQRRGLGRALMIELIKRCTDAGWRQMLAVIGDRENEASIKLHTALGFEQVGVLSAVGWKMDRWLDVVLMQRSLGVGSYRPPSRERAPVPTA